MIFYICFENIIICFMFVYPGIDWEPAPGPSIFPEKKPKRPVPKNFPAAVLNLLLKRISMNGPNFVRLYCQLIFALVSRKAYLFP